MHNPPSARPSPITGDVAGQSNLCEHRIAHTPQQIPDFNALYKRHGQEIWALAFRLLSDAEAAHDTMQETFLRLFKQLQIGEMILNPRAWLMRVCRNLAEDYRKRPASRLLSKKFDPEDLDNIKSRELSPFESAHLCEALTALDAALASLATELRTFILHYMEGMTIDQISAKMNIPRITVWRRIHLAKHQLQKRMAPWLDTNIDLGLAPAS